MKMLLQETWQKGLHWDNLPKDLKDAWENWCSEIEHFSKFQVPRKYFPQGELTAPEIEKAELYWIKQTQQFIFNREIDSLKREKSIEKDSKLYSLNPKLDENGLLVVTGRLQFSEFSQKEKHPWILPNGEKFTILLIQYAHKKVLHFGIASTLAHLRENIS
ncbi:protein pygopus [Trichonephila clavata]|uniref:Protein pygopus n=1 Tax=Trichonephila clavata TaxID=2740835 RepID=A0A8X6L2L2_TRICU|nr:protein pygopus [Trichonephila clavata]